MQVACQYGVIVLNMLLGSKLAKLCLYMRSKINYIFDNIEGYTISK